MSSEAKGTFSVFRVSKEYFAINAASVIEIMTIPHVTHVPKANKYMKGLFNHRGKILSLIDSSVRLELPVIEIDERTPLMVIHYTDGNKMLEFGIVVDEVLEVLEIQSDHIQEYPSEDTPFDHSFILGIFNYKGQHVTVLDVKQTYAIK